MSKRQKAATVAMDEGVLLRVENLCQLGVLGIGDADEVLQPFRVAAGALPLPFTAKKRIQSEMDHHTKLRLLKPCFAVHV